MWITTKYVDVIPTGSNSKVNVTLDFSGTYDKIKYGFFCIWHYEILYTNSHNYQQITLENMVYNETTMKMTLNCLCATNVSFKLAVYPLLVLR